MRRIGKLLGEGRLVTLVGPGGAGKTRLANEAVGRLVDAARRRRLAGRTRSGHRPGRRAAGRARPRWACATRP